MQVGDYVRTDRGIIAKIIRINTTGSITCDRSVYFGFNIVNSKRTLCNLSKIIKSNPKLIKLIQVGDYVNGHRVYEVKENCVLVGYKCFKTEFDNEEDFLYQTIYEEDIKSIVTKEQFESMEYKVGE